MDQKAAACKATTRTCFRFERPSCAGWWHHEDWKKMWLFAAQCILIIYINNVYYQCENDVLIQTWYNLGSRWTDWKGYRSNRKCLQVTRYWWIFTVLPRNHENRFRRSLRQHDIQTSEKERPRTGSLHNIRWLTPSSTPTTPPRSFFPRFPPRSWFSDGSDGIPLVSIITARIYLLYYRYHHQHQYQYRCCLILHVVDENLHYRVDRQSIGRIWCRSSTSFEVRDCPHNASNLTTFD